MILILCNLHLTFYKASMCLRTAIIKGCKNDNFQMKNCDILLIVAQKHKLSRFYRVPSISVLSKHKETQCIPLKTGKSGVGRGMHYMGLSA